MDFTGVAIGSGVNQYMKMDEMARQNKKLEMEKALADQQLSKGQYELNTLREIDSLNNEMKDVNAAIARGDYLTNPTVKKWLGAYDSNDGPFNDGHRTQIVANPKGGQVMNFVDAEGNVARTVDLNPQNLQQLATDYYRGRMQYLTPDHFVRMQQLGQKDREIQAISDYRKDQGRLIDEQIRTGNWGAFGLHQAQARNVGAPAQMNPYQAYQLQQMQNFDKARNDIVGQLEAKQITPDEANRRLNILGMKYGGHLGNGNAQSSEGKVKVTLDNGMEFTGSPAQAEQFRINNDPVYRAGNGVQGNNGLAMKDPRKNKQPTAPAAQPVAPAVTAPAVQPVAPAVQQQADPTSYKQLNKVEIGQNRGFVPQRGLQVPHSRDAARSAAQESAASQQVERARQAHAYAQSLVDYDMKTVGKPSPYHAQMLQEATAAYQSLVK